jgi:hypothetical protein
MRRCWIAMAVGFLAAIPAGAEARAEAATDEEPRPFHFDIGFELKSHLRDSEQAHLPVNFPFRPDQLPPGQSQAFLETVNEGTHLELSTLTLLLDATWSDALTAHAKVDVVDLYDRNPTSTDSEIDVDEAWVRFGSESQPAVLPERGGLYLKVGKFGKFERQDDRHLESYGLASTAFNRFEDTGVEVGVDVARHLYVRLSGTQGNPVFMRDPNALAGDNGTPAFLRPNPQPQLKSGIVVPYDAEVEDLDADGDLELGAGAGVRFADAGGRRGVDFMVWGYERTLAEKVELEGTFYGGDLDLLDGPFGPPALPLTGDEKSEVGANLWLYLGGFSLFAQYVDQELGGLPRTGMEAEAAWRFELPLVWAMGERQVLPFVAPAVRWSRLDPEFGVIPGRPTPTPSFTWEWDKVDTGVRLGLVTGVDLTVELADNTFTLASGRDVSNDELLVTLRWRE